MDEEEARYVLNVDDGATKDEINKRFREASKEVHPDAGGSADLFQQAKTARDILIAQRETNSSGSDKYQSDVTENRREEDANNSSKHEESNPEENSLFDRPRGISIIILISGIILFTTRLISSGIVGLLNIPETEEFLIWAPIYTISMITTYFKGIDLWPSKQTRSAEKYNPVFLLLVPIHWLGLVSRNFLFLLFYLTTVLWLFQLLMFGEKPN